MIKPGRDGWTDEQILGAINAVDGMSEVRFRYDVLRGGVRRTSISGDGSVSMDRFNDIQRTARFTLREEIDWLRDEIKPYMLLRMPDEQISAEMFAETWGERDALGYEWGAFEALGMDWDSIDASVFGSNEWEKRFAEFPLGVFVPSTPTRNSSNAATSWAVEAYDRTVILAEDSLTAPLFIAAGTAYLDAAQSVLAGAGITQVMVISSVATQLPADRIFEIGDSKLKVINTLLSEINYNPIYCDADGVFVLSQYVEPSVAGVEFSYRADRFSVIGRDTSSDIDFYKVPNVFIAVCSNPDIATPLHSVYTNDNPASRLSTVARGRTITSEVYKPDAVASQGDLDAYVRRRAFEANQVYETLKFNTALNPLHERADVLEIQHPDATGVYVESRWTLTMAADGKMTHEARRLVSL